ncbi:MAG TPA: histidinol-phosphate transaminase [Halomicronema sp.]
MTIDSQQIMLNFLRSDLNQLRAYTPHPGGSDGEPVSAIIDRLDTNESPYDLPSEIKQKLAFSFEETIESNRYPDGGHTTLKQSISEYVNEAGANINAANISIGNGSDELIRSILIATCVGGEGSVLVANPTFSMYGILAQTLGVPVITVGRNESNFEIDLQAAQQAIETSQNVPVRVVFVVHPNSPTANALSQNEINWLKNLPQNILIVIDEAYFEFSQTTLVKELPQHPNWIILRTFSKAFRLAAHRIGYAISSPEIITVLEKVRLPYNLPSFTQIAAQVCLSNRQFLLSVIPEIINQKNQLISELSQMPKLQIWPSNANFIYLRIKNTENQEESLTKLTAELKKQGTLVRHTGGGIRLTVGTPEENTRTLQRLQQILDTIF